MRERSKKSLSTVALGAAMTLLIYHAFSDPETPAGAPAAEGAAAAQADAAPAAAAPARPRAFQVDADGDLRLAEGGTGMGAPAGSGPFAAGAWQSVDGGAAGAGDCSLDRPITLYGAAGERHCLGLGRDCDAWSDPGFSQIADDEWQRVIRYGATPAVQQTFRAIPATQEVRLVRQEIIAFGPVVRSAGSTEAASALWPELPNRSYFLCGPAID